jgi:HD-GYP domain-containing protein (c-di-GMP phosphodiesterase class II)
MRLVPTSSVRDGVTLARDVPTGRSDGIPLLRAGVTINSAYRRGLLQAGIHAVYIEDEYSAGIVPEQLVSEETRTVATRAVATAYKAATETVVSGQPVGERMLSSLATVVERILLEIADTGGAALALADLSAADSYTFQHSVDVTALGLLIGQRMLHDHGWVDYTGRRRFTRFDERLLQLGLGLLLHDIGKLAIPHELLHKPGRLNEAEWEIMKTHPCAGYELLRNSNCTPLTLAVVLRHHERWNGSGYPDGKVGTSIHEMARIAAVADVYDAVTSERVYAPAQPAHTGVRVILEGAGTAFDPAIVEVFSKLVAPFPPGVELELDDGRRAVVVSCPDQALDRPVVRVISGPGSPHEISLLRDPTVGIASWNVRQPAVAA